jgi:uncharacterized protein (TIGR00266 family)
MEFQIKHAPVFSTLEFTLAQDEFVVAQPNSMLTMTSDIVISAHVGRHVQADGDAERSSSPPRRSGWWGGFKSMLGGENFFTAEFAAKGDGQTVMLAPESDGDILPLHLTGESGYFLTRGSYLANIGQTAVNVKYGGLKGLMSRKGLFLMHATGTGHVFCQTYGAIQHRYLGPDEMVIIDNRFVVAFSDSVKYRLIKATQSIKDSLMSGEGLVNQYRGPGDVYFQTRGKPSGGLLTTLFQAAF